MHRSSDASPRFYTLEDACLVSILSSHCVKGVVLRLGCQHRQAPLIALLDALVST